MTTAHHEAGHAVAAVMRGGSSLTSVILSERHGEGITWHRAKPADQGFIAFAGPWAEARHQWQGDDPELDSEDAEWVTFGDYVTGVILTQPDDGALVIEAEREWSALGDLLPPGTPMAHPSHTWHRELSRVWAPIQTVARWLLEGEPVTDERVRQLVEG